MKPRPDKIKDWQGWMHFGIASAILLVTLVGWNWTIAALKWATKKEPVPWAQAVKVDRENFRLLSLPDRFGPYRMVEKIGDIPGDIVLYPDELELLKIGTSLDRARVDQRRSNWYVARIYEDTGSRRNVFALWRLDVFYYTGALDKVPHVPERCGAAAGAVVVGSQEVKFSFSGTPTPWNGPVGFQRAILESYDKITSAARQQVTYYTFSLNGRPEPSWKNVRLALNKPWMRYCYFAKIQFTPLAIVADISQADAAAAEFAREFLPGVLAMMPMPADIDRLESQEQSED